MIKLGRPNWPISDTALAAALATLSIPLIKELPYSHTVNTEKDTANVAFHFAGGSPQGDKTEDMIKAWECRAQFEADPKFKDHPLHKIRRGHDARLELLAAIHNPRPVPKWSRAQKERYKTILMHEAVVLIACGLGFLGIERPVFVFEDRAACQACLHQAQKAKGTLPRWVSIWAQNHERLLHIAKHAPRTLATPGDGQNVVLLSEDATRKVRDKFLDML